MQERKKNELRLLEQTRQKEKKEKELLEQKKKISE